MDFAVAVGSFLGNSRPFGHLCGMGSLQAWAVAEPVCEGFLARCPDNVCHLLAVRASESAHRALWRAGVGILHPLYFCRAFVLVGAEHLEDV